MVRVAVDATALLGRPTGVGVAVRGLLDALAARPPGGAGSAAPEAGLDLVGFGQTGTGWRALPGLLPRGVRPCRRPMPAGALHRVWGVLDLPPVEWWTGPVDVVHGTNFVVPPARKAARLVTVNDLTPVRYPQLCTPDSLRYPHLVERAVAGGASVHTATAAVAAEIREHFRLPAERVHVIPWGAPAPAAARPAPTGAARWPAASPPAPGRPYILGLGTVEPRKDFPLLVDAFDRLAGRHPDLTLRITGPDGWGAEALAAAVAASPNRRRIQRDGWVADPRAVLAGAVVLAYPSVYEGFGFPPLEAMALGVPVVATAAGGVPEVVGDAALVVPPGDADALAAALALVVDDEATRRRLADAGRRRVAELGWDRTAAAMAELYLALAASRA